MRGHVFLHNYKMNIEHLSYLTYNLPPPWAAPLPSLDIDWCSWAIHSLPSRWKIYYRVEYDTTCLTDCITLNIRVASLSLRLYWSVSSSPKYKNRHRSYNHSICRNISSRFSWNSEADASEFQENHEEMFRQVYMRSLLGHLSFVFAHGFLGLFAIIASYVWW